MSTVIRRARADEGGLISEILQEAVRWLNEKGEPMWKDGEISVENVEEDVQNGLFYVVWVEGQPAGVFKLQMEDELFWPDVPQRESVFLHRLAVRRMFSGKGIPRAIMEKSKQYAAVAGRRFLRLDCEAHRAKLCVLYEQLGFVRHSERQVGPYYARRYQYEVKGPSSQGA